MKTKNFSLSRLKKYNHPAILLFRGIELKVLSTILPKYNLKKPSMDLGSGDGFISSLIFKDNFTYGVDNNEAKDTREAIRHKRYKKVLIESAEKMSLKTDSLNFVFSNSVIEHIPQNNKVLSEVSRILKPKGLFIFTCPSSYFTSYLSSQYGKKYAEIRNKHLNHYHLLSFKQWEKRLNTAGFNVLDYQYYMTKKDLIFWDKMVWLNKLLFFLLPLRPPIMSALFEKRVQKLVSKALTSKDEGANILVIAEKK